MTRCTAGQGLTSCWNSCDSCSGRTTTPTQNFRLLVPGDTRAERGCIHVTNLALGKAFEGHGDVAFVVAREVRPCPLALGQDVPARHKTQHAAREGPTKTSRTTHHTTGRTTAAGALSGVGGWVDTWLRWCLCRLPCQKMGLVAGGFRPCVCAS